MQHIYVNLKRFDVPVELGGVNRLAPVENWARHIVEAVQTELQEYQDQADFSFFFPEAHLLAARSARRTEGLPRLGSQGLHCQDVAPGGNFGAFTTSLPAAAARSLGAELALIGHCEERRALGTGLALAGQAELQGQVVNRLLQQEIEQALNQGLDVLYCIGEQEAEQERWQEVLGAQLEQGLGGCYDARRIRIAYEPIWSIGPGKQAADRAYIQKVARFVRDFTGGLEVVYGGGLKQDNAQMLASIPEISGGLIALTRFSGEIGFYPEEFLDIVRLYLGQKSADSV